MNYPARARPRAPFAARTARNATVVQVRTEHVRGVGDVETVDVPLGRANVKLLRALLEERAGCAYAVTDAPMVQLEMSGEWWVSVRGAFLHSGVCL